MKFKRFKSLIKDHTHLSINIDRSEINQELLQFIPSDSTKNPRINRKWISLAMSALMFLIMITSFTVMEFTPSKVFSIDINPGFEITLNRFNRVVAINAVSEDANPIIDDLSFWHKSPEKVLRNIYEVALNQGYEENYIAMLISVDSNDEVVINKLSAQADKLNIKTVFMSTYHSSFLVFTAKLETRTESSLASDSIDFYSPIIEYPNDVVVIPSSSDAMNNSDIVTHQIWTESTIKSLASSYQVTLGKIQLVIAIFDAYPEYDTLEDFNALVDSSIARLISLYENRPN